MDQRSDAFLQRRLATFAKHMFFAFLVLRIGEFTVYRTYREVWPNHYWTIFAVGTASVGVLAIAWLVLSRVDLAHRWLLAIDFAIMGCCGTVFGAIAILASNRPESAYTCLVYASFVVFTRTIVVPSSGRRTAAVAALAMVPLAVAALVLAIEVDEDVPGAAFVGGGLMYTGVAVVIAATGSRVIYGLRARVSSLVSDELELGQYRLVRKVGSGPVGDVFVARHALLRRPTAVKLVEPRRVGVAALARYERAVRETSQLRHHNTIAVYDYGHSLDGRFYFSMEYLDGLGLDELHERYGAQPPGRVIAIVLQLCGALHEAHRRGFAHGNLKPSNVILCERGGLHDVAKLTDFGFGGVEATPSDDLRALAALARDLVADASEHAAIDACFASAESAREVAVKLRALDLPWSPASARAWWSERRRASAPVLSVTTDLPVDLGRRGLG